MLPDPSRLVIVPITESAATARREPLVSPTVRRHRARSIVYALYYFPGNASLVPHMMLREIGAAFELRLVDRAQNASTARNTSSSTRMGASRC
jgi:hypothetical protein